MSVTLTFTAATPEDMEHLLAEWEDVLCKGRLTIEAANQSNALAAQAQMAAARAAKEEAQRAETHAANVKALKEMAAQLKEQEAPPLDPAPSAEAVQAVVSAEDTLLSSGPENSSSVSSVEPALLGGADVPDTTYDDTIKPRMLQLSLRKGREAVFKVLGTFDVPNVRDVPEDKWPELLALIDELLGS